MRYEIKRFDRIKTGSFKHHPEVPECEGKSANRDLRMMMLSVQSAGVLVPVVIDEELRVIDGWLRIRASEALGIEKVPAFVVDTDDARAAHCVLDIGLWKNRKGI